MARAPILEHESKERHRTEEGCEERFYQLACQCCNKIGLELEFMSNILIRNRAEYELIQEYREAQMEEKRERLARTKERFIKHTKHGSVFKKAT